MRQAVRDNARPRAAMTAGAALRALPHRGGRVSLRPGLLDLYLIRGVAGSFAMLVGMLGVAMMLERALRLINDLAGRGADLSYFFPILAQLVPYYLDLAIPAAFMVALVLLVARLDDRLELEAMLASGLSLGRIAAPLVGFGLAVGVASLAVSGWLEPYGRHGVRTLSAEAVNAGLIGRLQPGGIYQPAGGFVLTFDARARDGGVRGLFVRQLVPGGRELVMTGQSGRIDFVRGARNVTVALRRGVYVSEGPGRMGGRRFAFDGIAVHQPLRLARASWPRGADQKEMTLTELADAVRTGTAHGRQDMIEAELFGRLGRAALVPLIPLIVLPLAMTTKKGRRALGVLAGGILLALLNHSLNFAKQLTWLGYVHGGTSTLAISLFGAMVVLLVFYSGRHLPSHSPLHDLLKPIGSALVRLRRERSTAAAGSSRRVLAFYFAAQLARWTGLSLIIAVLILQMVDLFDRSDELLERGVGLGGVAYYSWLQLPFLAQQSLPLASLAGAMAVFVDFGRSSEMTAIRAAGISQWRILLLALPVPVLLALVTLGLSEAAVPRTQTALAKWWTATEPAARVPESRWFRIGNEIVEARRASADGRTLSGVRIFRREPAGTLVERVAADTAERQGQGWRLRNAERLQVAGGANRSDRLAAMAWPTPLVPGDVAAFFSSTQALSFATAVRALDDAAPVSQSQSRFKTRIQRLGAASLAPILMLLLALPLAFVAPRTGVAWPATLYAAGGGLLYWVADGVLTVFAQVGFLPAVSGAWAAPLVVLLGGLTVLVYTER